MQFKYLLTVCVLVGSITAVPTGDTEKVTLTKTPVKGWESIFGTNVTSLVQLLYNDDKSYYFGFNFKATWFQAAQFCDDIHMKLVNIESVEENDRIYKYVRDANKGDWFWTSGSKLLDGKHWVWMSKGKSVEYTNWAPGNPDSQVEHCIAAFHSKNVGLTWTDRDCLVQMGFICERKISSNNTIENEGETPQWSSIYEDPITSPNVPLFHSKHKSYFLGRYFKATYQEAMQLCKMMNMDLISVTSKEENDRIFKYIRDTNAGDTFWTSGTRMIDGTTWIWMSSAKLVDYTNWHTGQPDSTVDHCIQLLVQKDKGLFWTDSGCALRLSYICEKPRNDRRIIFPSARAAFISEDIGYSESQSELETSKNIELNLIHMENQSYYLGRNFKLTQFEAAQFCQRHKMELLSIPTKEINEEIRQLLLHHAGPSESFWTSAKKSNDYDFWTWSSGSALKFSNFKTEVSETLDRNKNCVEIPADVIWRGQQCELKLFFICVRSQHGKSCPKVPPILNIYVEEDPSSKNNNVPYHSFKVDNTTIVGIPELL